MSPSDPDHGDAVTAVAPLLSGTRLGVYEITMLLGAGGMGRVYKARDSRLGRPVALKVLSERLSRDARASRSIEREAKAISLLNHPHICTLYDIGHDQGIDYLVMEFLAGQTVREQLDCGPFAPQSVICYGLQVAEALAEAHRCGLLHGDLKPSNVMITANGAKVLDFGLARPLDLALSSGDLSSTSLGSDRIGGAAGTLPYMSPEQLEGEVSDARSDIFSYGAVLYEMVSGRRAFRAVMDTALVSEILRCNPAPLPGRGAGTQTLGRVIKRCLVRNPDMRWQRFDDIVGALGSSGSHGKPRLKLPAAPQKTGVWSIRRIAVLPFENRSPATLEEYVPDGLTDALTAALSVIRSLRVISRTSSRRIDPTDLGAIARTLGVDAVIRGTITGSAERIEARIELVQVPSGEVLWGETYDSPLDDVLRAQKDIASTMAITLQLTLTPSDRRRVQAAWSRDPAANEAYLRGRYFLDRGTLESLRRSFQYLSTALQKDPNHGRAHAALAEWYVSAAPFRLVARSEALPQSKAAALSAITLDPMLAEAHTCLGLIAKLEWDLHRALVEFKQALQLNPNSTNALRGLARCALWLGHRQEAIDQIESFKQLDPVAPKTHLTAASIYYCVGDYERAIAACFDTLELESQSEPAQYFLAMSQHFSGHSDPAIELLTRLGRTCPPLLSGLAYVLAQSGRVGDARGVIEEMKDRATTQEEVSPYDFAEAFIGLGDRDRALAYLNRACELRMPEMIGVALDPVFTPLRDHPGFTRILRTIGLDAGRATTSAIDVVST